MINGAHIAVYSKNPEADRAFFRDVLKFRFVDAGHEWLIFALPAAESAFHPAEANDKHELYLMCDDVTRENAALVFRQRSQSPANAKSSPSLTSKQNGCLDPPLSLSTRDGAIHSTFPQKHSQKSSDCRQISVDTREAKL
jgi:hypothetical protein